MVDTLTVWNQRSEDQQCYNSSPTPTSSSWIWVIFRFFATIPYFTEHTCCIMVTNMDTKQRLGYCVYASCCRSISFISCCYALILRRSAGATFCHGKNGSIWRKILFDFHTRFDVSLQTHFCFQHFFFVVRNCWSCWNFFFSFFFFFLF